MVSYPRGYAMPATRHDQVCVVRDETLELDCAALRATNRCDVRHRFTMHATGTCSIQVPQPLAAPPRLDGTEMVRVHDTLWVAPGMNAAPDRDSLGDILIPDGVHVVERTWSDEGAPYTPTAVGGVEPDRARHLFLHAGRSGRTWPFVFDVPALARRAPDYALTLVLTPPRDLAWKDRDPRWARDGTRWTARIQPRPDQDGRVMELNFAYTDSPVHHGGPMIGVGAVADRDGVRRTVRMEYELGVRNHVLPGVSVETGPAWVLTPRVELSTMTRAIMRTRVQLYPWHTAWSAGVGVPVRLDGTGPDTVRLLAGAHWFLLGLSAAVDVPTRAEGTLRGSLVTRLSL